MTATVDRGPTNTEPEVMHRWIFDKVVPGRFNWMPEVVARVAASGDLSVTTDTAADVPGASLSFAPPVRMDLLVSASADAEVVAAGSVLALQLAVSPSPISSAQGVSRLDASAGRFPMSLSASMRLERSVTYTIKLQALLDAAGGEYTIKSAGTGLVAIATAVTE